MPLCKWSDPGNQFNIPPVLRKQMLLTPSELAIYGNHHLLPPNKRIFSTRSPAQAEVLAVRKPDVNAPLPTLCASYGSQHHLQMEHLLKKGIFANIVCCDGEYSFLDPFLFAALFGAIDDVVVPTKAALAWKFIGNAITVQQALVTCAIGIQAITTFKLDIRVLIDACWSNRVRAWNTVFFVQDDFIVLSKAEDVVHAVASAFCAPSHGPPALAFEVRFDEVFQFSGQIAKDWTLSRIVLEVFGLSDSVLPCLRCSSPEEVRPCLSHTAAHLGNMSPTWTLHLADQEMCSFDLRDCLDMDPQVISPTLPFVPEQPCIGLCSSQDLDDLLHTA